MRWESMVSASSESSGMLADEAETSHVSSWDSACCLESQFRMSLASSLR